MENIDNNSLYQKEINDKLEEINTCIKNLKFSKNGYIGAIGMGASALVGSIVGLVQNIEGDYYVTASVAGIIGLSSLILTSFGGKYLYRDILKLRDWTSQKNELEDLQTKQIIRELCDRDLNIQRKNILLQIYNLREEERKALLKDIVSSSLLAFTVPSAIICYRNGNIDWTSILGFASIAETTLAVHNTQKFIKVKKEIERQERNHDSIKLEKEARARSKTLKR